jgi:hypothetical protein
LWPLVRIEPGEPVIIAGSSNGRTVDSDSIGLGSNPSLASKFNGRLTEAALSPVLKTGGPLIGMEIDTASLPPVFLKINVDFIA